MKTKQYTLDNGKTSSLMVSDNCIFLMDLIITGLLPMVMPKGKVDLYSKEVHFMKARFGIMWPKEKGFS